MKRLTPLVALFLVSTVAARAAEIGKPAVPGVELPSAPLSAAFGPQLPGAPLPALPAQIPAALASAAPKISAIGGNVPGLPQAAAPAGAPEHPAARGVDAPQTALEQVRAVRGRLEAQLRAMEGVLGASDPVLEHVRAEAHESLTRIEGHIAAGRIHPALGIRTQEDAPEVLSPRTPRVGVYPVAADPFQWAHLLIGLRAMAEFQLDKVIFVLAGDDARKPTMTPVLHRHPMGRAVLEAFLPLFGYSSIAVGTDYDGETNIFRMLALNPAQAVHAFYLVGGDHYKLKDKNGNDDTIPKIEKKSRDAALGHDPDKHRVSVAFIARGDEGERIPTALEVHFLPSVPFEASSTQIRRDGQYALMPHAAYQWVLDNLPGHYGIPTPK